MTLPEFLVEGASKPFVWGVCDCSLWPADWIATSRGCDPAADLRGTYSCWMGAVRRIRRSGGLAWIFAPRLEAIGMRATIRPRFGDLGVVQAPMGIVGAIRAQSGWAVKRETGVMIEPFETIAAWAF